MKMRFTKSNIKLFSILGVVVFSSFYVYQRQNKPTLYLIGDSTVKNGSGNGSDGLWGWGNFIADKFDTTRINVKNNARGGTSSRSFINFGLWNNIVTSLKPGDYVIMQFGHNDDGPLDDTVRARGTIKSAANESKEIYNPILKKNETVFSYGWYIGKYITEAKAKGATPVVCSLIPRNDWSNGKVTRATQNYSAWAKEAAEKNGAYYIDLNTIIADIYDIMGEEKVKAYFPADHVHTDIDGAKLNATAVVDGIKSVKELSLNQYLLNNK